MRERLNGTTNRKMNLIGIVGLTAILFPAFAGVIFPASQGQVDETIRRVETGLIQQVQIKGQPARKWNLADRMALHRVPAVSIAVIRDYRIEWARAYGWRDADAKAPATVDTLFQAASISKPVAAAAALGCVEKGLIGLDDEVNGRLTSWKVPENEFTAGQKVTLRRILSHSAGLTVHGFGGYPTGTAVPTLLQVLNGENPANSAPVRVDLPPGSRWRYSGGGYTVMQQLLIDLLKKPFPEIMKETVLGPAAMTRSTYEQPLPDPLLDTAAVGYKSDGNPITGRRNIYPEMAAAGLWTTPSDLGRFAIEIMKSVRDRPGALLSSAMAKRMLTLEKPPSGLGLMVEGKNDDLQANHGGSNAGFNCYLVFYPARGLGAAIMTNSDNGSVLYGEILLSLASAYGMTGFNTIEKALAPVKSELLSRYAGKYTVTIGGQESVAAVSTKKDHLILSAMDSEFELFPETETKFFTMDMQLSVVFQLDAGGTVTGFLANNRLPGRKRE